MLELVALVLIRLSRLHQIERLAEKARKQIQREVHRTHQGIADAVVAGDRELARHRMRRHLEALATHALDDCYASFARPRRGESGRYPLRLGHIRDFSHPTRRPPLAEAANEDGWQ